MKIQKIFRLKEKHLENLVHILYKNEKYRNL